MDKSGFGPTFVGLVWQRRDSLEMRSVGNHDVASLKLELRR